MIDQNIAIAKLNEIAVEGAKVRARIVVVQASLPRDMTLVI